MAEQNTRTRTPRSGHLMAVTTCGLRLSGGTA